eukprot:jgi/Botrbrau1/11676/Bobra.0195s0007.1
MGISGVIGRLTGLAVSRGPEDSKQDNTPQHVKATSLKEAIGSDQPLLSPYKAGMLDLDIRVVYAPLTRCRAIGNIPQPAAVTYYSQRAHRGAFMLSEGTSPSPTGHGYPQTPGIYTDEQVEAWKPITRAVKEKGATFFCQLWHVGRASHSAYQPGGKPPLGPSAIAIEGQVMLPDYKLTDYPVPREISKAEIKEVTEEFVQAAKNALRAGFDGVEIHGANAYLLDEFLKDGSNKRTDEYGGSIENRARFHIEVAKAVADAVGPEKVGMRLSPYGTFMNTIDSDPIPGTRYLVQQLSELGLAYVHVVEGRIVGHTTLEDDPARSLEPFRQAFKGTFIAAGGYTRESGNQSIAEGKADLITFGRYFLANPDLPERFAINAPLNRYNRDTFYTPSQEVGYTDYPFLANIDLVHTRVIDHHGVKVFDLPVGSEREQGSYKPVKFSN